MGFITLNVHEEYTFIDLIKYLILHYGKLILIILYYENL